MTGEAMEVREGRPGYGAKDEGVPPGYRRTEVGVIPEEWEVSALHCKAALLSGHHVLARYCNEDGIGTPYLTGPADFPEGRIELSKFTTRPSTVCLVDDVLVTVKGSGAGAIVMADGRYCISRQLMAIRPEKADARYLYYSLMQTASRLKGAATGLIPGLSRADLLDETLPFPTALPEQRAIARALSDVDDLISALDKLIEKKRAIKQATMQQLLTGRTRLPGFSGEWEHTALRHIGEFSKGQGIARSDVVAEGLPCVRYGELYTHYRNWTVDTVSHVTAEAARLSRPISKGDLLFAASGETAEEIGACVAYLGNETAYAGGDTVVLTPRDADSCYLGYLLNHQSIQAQKARMAQGDAVVHISARNLARLEFDLPPLPEQCAIAAVLSDMDAEIDALERQREKTRLIKQGMMQELLTGRIRLVEPSTVEAGNG